MVSILTLYSVDPSSNSAEVFSFFSLKMFKIYGNIQNRPWVVPLLKEDLNSFVSGTAGRAVSTLGALKYLEGD